MEREEIAFREEGREFQTCAAATGKARAPTVLSLEEGIRRLEEEEERSGCLDVMEEVSWM